MLIIRFQRTGRRNTPMFRLVVTEKSTPIKGKVKEYIGHYLPTRTPHVFEFKKERVEHWISVGAQPTNTVARLLKKEGMENMDKFMKSYTKKRKRKEVPEEEKKAPAPISAPSTDVEKTKEEAPKKEESTEEVKEEPKKEDVKEDDNTEKKE